jgi:hypothetical protein
MGYLEDYAFYADGLLALYQTTFDPRWFQEARALMDVVLEHFPDLKKMVVSLILRMTMSNSSLALKTCRITRHLAAIAWPCEPC